MDDRYKQQGFIEDRLIEECSELIKAITKAKRFGWFSRWPEYDSETNLDAIFREMDDVRKVMHEMQKYLLDMARQDQIRRSLISGRLELSEPPQIVHYLSSPFGCAKRAEPGPGIMSDSWKDVTCPECLKNKPKEDV